MERLISVIANSFCERENINVSAGLIGKEPKIDFATIVYNPCTRLLG